MTTTIFVMIKVTVTRSEEWVKRQRIDLGANIRDTIEVTVDPTELSEAARVALIQNDNSYCDVSYLKSRARQKYYQLNYSHAADGQKFFVDEFEPTIEQVDAAIVTAAGKVADEMAKIAAEEKQREADEIKLSEARVLLADEFEKLEQEVRRQEKLAADCKADRKILGDFLVSIPLKTLTENATLARRRAIEDASPVWIFSNRDWNADIRDDDDGIPVDYSE